MTELYNQASERDKRRSLRNNMPVAEKIIWTRLRGCQVEGCKFRRQFSIGAFVVDFYAPELKLAIEIDGSSHFEPGVPEYDEERQLFLESKGTQILRFRNEQVYGELEVVVEAIGRRIRELRGCS